MILILATSIISSILFLFIIYKIIINIQNKGFLLTGTYLYLLLSLILFLYLLFTKIEHSQISLNLSTLIKQLFFTLFEAMIASFLILIVLSFLILLMILNQGRNG